MALQKRKFGIVPCEIEQKKRLRTNHKHEGLLVPFQQLIKPKKKKQRMKEHNMIIQDQYDVLLEHKTVPCCFSVHMCNIKRTGK